MNLVDRTTGDGVGDDDDDGDEEPSWSPAMRHSKRDKNKEPKDLSRLKDWRRRDDNDTPPRPLLRRPKGEKVAAVAEDEVEG